MNPSAVFHTPHSQMMVKELLMVCDATGHAYFCESALEGLHWCILGRFPSLRLSQSHSLFPSLGLAVQNTSFVAWQVAWWAAQSQAACLCDGLQKRHVEPITHLHAVTGLTSSDPCTVRNRDQ